MTAFLAMVETYLSDLRRIRGSGGATAEVSSYGPLELLLNAVGAGLRPKVFCVGQLKDQGAGHPDFGLYASRGRGVRGSTRPAADGGPAHHERGEGEEVGGGAKRTDLRVGRPGLGDAAGGDAAGRPGGEHGPRVRNKSFF